MNLAIRDARPSDHETIVAFNLALALETEGKHLDPAIVSRGVGLALDSSGLLRYWVAELDGRLVGQSAVSREWSDWRCGWIWWLQSVYVASDARGRGVFRALHAHIRSVALESEDVIGLRLYVERENHPAQRTYQSLGMTPGGYLVFEELWPDRFGRPG